MIERMSPQEIAEKEDLSKIALLDVRSTDEFEDFRATIAKSLPLENVNTNEVGKMFDLDEGQNLYVICRSGKRSYKACEALKEQGFSGKLVNVEGGTLAWVESDLPHQGTPENG